MKVKLEHLFNELAICGKFRRRLRKMFPNGKINLSRNTFRKCVKTLGKENVFNAMEDTIYFNLKVKSGRWEVCYRASAVDENWWENVGIDNYWKESAPILRKILK